MPINTALLEQIKNNDPTLKTLDLTKQNISDDDIQPLVKALATNTMLTSLKANDNQIGNEGAKALAANTIFTELALINNLIGDKGIEALAANTTLTQLSIGKVGHLISDKGIKALAANKTLIFLYVFGGDKISAEGAKALAANKTLATLFIGGKNISDEGVKALAANTTLTTLNVWGHHNIGDESAKALAANTTLTSALIGGYSISNEGVKALAANTNFTELHLLAKKVDDEGAKALATNTLIISLDVKNTQISAEWQKQLNEVVARNKQDMIQRRDQFMQKLILLAADKANSESQSLWSRLPKEVMLHIVSLMDFRSASSIGKSAHQIKACAVFIFNHIAHLKASLTEAIQTRQNFKVMEKIMRGKSHFHFFPLPPAPKAEEKGPERSNDLKI